MWILSLGSSTQINFGGKFFRYLFSTQNKSHNHLPLPSSSNRRTAVAPSVLRRWRQTRAVSSSTLTRLQSEPILLQLSMILFFKTTLVPRRRLLRGVSPMFSPFFFWFRCEIKSIIVNWNIIGSDCSRVGVDEETALVCLQRRRTDGATAVRRLDGDGRGGWLWLLFCVLQ